jgi:hypothetical protein
MPESSYAHYICLQNLKKIHCIVTVLEIQIYEYIHI